MTRDMIVQLWEAEGAKLSGHTVNIREDREATCFVQTNGDIMSVPRVTKLDLRDTVIAIQTAKDERFIFAYDHILGFKLASTAVGKDRPPAGFGR